MRDFLKYFFPAVLLFVGVGFVAGWGDRSESVVLKLYSNSTVVSNQGKYFISIACDGRYIYRWSIDTNTGGFVKKNTSTQVAIHYQETNLNKPSEQHMKYVATLGTLLGGGFAEHSRRNLKQLIAQSKKKTEFWAWKNLKNNVYSALGMITGYAIGETFASNYDVGCESDIALEALANSEMWVNFRLQRFIATVNEIENQKDARIYANGAVDPYKRDPIVLCETTLSKDLLFVDTELRKTNPSFTSEHFARIDNIVERYKKAVFSPVYDELVRLSVMHVAKKKREKISGKKFEEQYKALAERKILNEEHWQQLCRQLEKLTIKTDL